LKKWISFTFAICLSLVMLASCGDVESQYVITTGWVIGEESDINTGIPTVKILKMNNGGQTWTIQALPDGCAGMLANDISAYDNNVAWAVGFRMSTVQTALPKGAIFFTSSGGINCEQQKIPAEAQNVDFWKVSFVGARR